MRMSLRWAQRTMNQLKQGENPNAQFGNVQGGM
jgi:queuine tRNA-ribosyltransferase